MNTVYIVEDGSFKISTAIFYVSYFYVTLQGIVMKNDTLVLNIHTNIKEWGMTF